MKAWVNHFALNLGSAIACLYYAIVPPQLTKHSRNQLDELSNAGLIRSFLDGLFS